MEAVKKLVSLAENLSNNDRAVSAALAAGFAVLVARSVGHQSDIDALEAEKASLMESNKEMKRSMWSWKQSLYADASDSESPPLVPLARLKAIYGEAPAALSKDGTLSL